MSTTAPEIETDRDTIPVEAESTALSAVASLMATDKSNDWSDEIATLSAVEKELLAAREQLETYRANVGSIEGLVLVSRYARIGKYTLASLGANEVWDSAGIASDISTTWGQMDDRGIGGQTPADLAYWRKIADDLGIIHDGDGSETCAEEDCDDSLDDGEGYDGYCGHHADQRENDGVYDGDDS